MVWCSLGKVSPVKSLYVGEVCDETQSCSISLDEMSEFFQRFVHAKRGCRDHGVSTYRSSKRASVAYGEDIEGFTSRQRVERHEPTATIRCHFHIASVIFFRDQSSLCNEVSGDSDSIFSCILGGLELTGNPACCCAEVDGRRPGGVQII